MKGPGWRTLLHTAQILTTHANVWLASLLQCAKMRETLRARNFLPFHLPITKLTTGLCGVSINSVQAALRPVARGYMSGVGRKLNTRVAQALKVI
jgi:hypothetical protein